MATQYNPKEHGGSTGKLFERAFIGGVKKGDAYLGKIRTIAEQVADQFRAEESEHAA